MTHISFLAYFCHGLVISYASILNLSTAKTEADKDRGMDLIHVTMKDVKPLVVEAYPPLLL